MIALYDEQIEFDRIFILGSTNHFYAFVLLFPEYLAWHLWSLQLYGKEHQIHSSKNVSFCVPQKKEIHKEGIEGV